MAFLPGERRVFILSVPTPGKLPERRPVAGDAKDRTLMSGGRTARERPGRTIRSASVDPEEIRRFSEVAEAWWDANGPFRALHRLNPTRLAYLRRHLDARFDREPRDVRPYRGLTVLDAGCGGGLLSEPLARLGAGVTAIDADPRAIDVAASHAGDAGLDIDYRRATVEEVAANGETFDIVVAMEIIEHVPDLATIVDALGRVAAPGGALALATLNRTLKSFALAIVGAEYVMRWLPRGTHRWRKFVRPSEVARHLRRHGFAVADITGVTFDPLASTGEPARIRPSTT